jgi:hypothetical protein
MSQLKLIGKHFRAREQAATILQIQKIPGALRNAGRNLPDAVNCACHQTNFHPPAGLFAAGVAAPAE